MYAYDPGKSLRLVSGTFCNLKAMGDGSIFYNPEELDADDAMMVLIHAWEGTPLNRDLIRKG